MIPSLADVPESSASAKLGIGSGTTGPATFDQSLAPITFTARTRNQYWVPLTSGASVSVTLGGRTLAVVKPTVKASFVAR